MRTRWQNANKMEKVRENDKKLQQTSMTKHKLKQRWIKVCPDKKILFFFKVSPSRNIVGDGACELWMRAATQQILPSCQASWMCSCATVVPCITVDQCMWQPAGKYIFEEVFKCVNEIKMPWDNLVGLTSDGVSTMCDEKSGLVCIRCRRRIAQVNWHYHCIIHQEVKQSEMRPTGAVNSIWEKGFKSTPIQVFSLSVRCPVTQTCTG